MTDVYTLSELAEKCNAQLQGDADKQISGLNTLQHAQGHELSFLANPAYAKYLETTEAGAVILSPDAVSVYSGNVLILDNPYLGYARLSALFDPDRGGNEGIHPSAVVDETATVDSSAAIGANVVIEAGVHIAAGARIDAGTVIGHDSIIGSDVHLHRNVTVCHGVTIGDRTIIHSGAVIGGDGFGNAYADGRWHKIAQIGGVVIGCDVEIGNNTCIDRGALGNTEIHRGVRLDNLIQIAHNVVIGENTAIASGVGISGSTTIGKNCTIAGAAGFAGHLTIADGTFISGMAMITRSITKAGSYSSGTGFMESREWRKNVIRFRQLDDLARRVKQLEKQRY
ncbi:UDP-3-O-(3-hydroxymyristoyl)glucosamine N-acyltransferase [Endozoicomonas sp. SCSIO W0465]|uniref:UDP-3-O-(3-hydroxymyristoyl)glucosamine N-acyltransferase n=1 Tax=Endozoicomonas sp. SCSIO W0465 TaxID=2918516 RepID=UPI002075154B|nr:UDP-3-O-(3-hydroxymyristoyl)glucosamine N-acyltransferase [Endozoicomonas sp. SCSIO W0465]USE34018.1 UDP-3-O-(3-hydroxymyristoyl)glucosamine N-acyltransferase [Endozoicomonas sp. SCSIO W0465]